MSKFLPRLGLVLPTDARAARLALQVVAKELIAAPTVDIILVGPGGRVRSLADGVAPRIIDPARPGDGLQAARAEGSFPLFESGPEEAPLDATARLVDAGAIDGYVALEPLGGPRLRLRNKVRVVEPFPDTSLRWLIDELPPSELARILERSSEVLQRLGTPRPVLVAFDLDGSPALDQALKLARSRGVNVVGPLSPRAALGREGDALVAFTPAQLELPLLLQGTGPETALALDVPCAWPTEAGPRTTVLAVDRLLKLLPAQGHTLAAQREESRRPSVSIAKKVRPAATPDRDRCPYCHMRLTESPDGGSSRPGPPVTCAECGTPHHRDCATEHGRCTTLGCPGTRVLRLGVAIPISRLGGESPREHPFVTLDGDTRLGPHWLRVEAPIDDPDARPTRRRLSLELASPELRRGTPLHGYVVVWAPRAFRIRGGALKLRASLTTRKLSGNMAVRTEPILGRQASFAGAGPAGTLGRLQDGVVSLFSRGTGVAIPAGVRRYPFSFELDGEHPASVRNQVGEVEETVTTQLEAFLDTDSSGVSLEVT